jgi:hypothetical protein
MKTVVQFGLFTGIASSLWMYLKYVNSIDNASFGGAAVYIPFLILFTGIGIGIYFRRSAEEFGQGFISFKEGARTGVIISLIAGLTLAAYAMVHFLVVSPEYLQEASESLRAAMEKDKKSATEIAQEIAQMKNDKSVGRLMFEWFTRILVIGMVGSFIIAALLKKEPASSEE